MNILQAMLNIILMIISISLIYRANLQLKFSREMAYSAMIGWTCVLISTIANLIILIK